MNDLDAVEHGLERSTRRGPDGLVIAFVRDDPAARRSGSRGLYTPGFIEILQPRAIRGLGGIEQTIHHELVHHEQQQAEDNGGRPGVMLREQYGQMGWVGNGLRDRSGNIWHYNSNTNQWSSPTVEGRISDAQMRERAIVRPGSSYFSAPWEMHAETLRLFRSDRQRLMTESPDLCLRARVWDQDDIDRRFGTEASGDSRAA